MIEIIFWILLFPNIITFFIVLYNYFTAPRMRNETNQLLKKSDLISILIPARNEEHNIHDCLESISRQSYKNLEIIVLDDQSEDKTAEKVRVYCKKDSRVKLINGMELPDDWLGKNWACHNLFLHSTASKLLFIDADVRLHENAVKIALERMNQVNAEMLSVFPTQIVEKFGSRLITPMMNWILLTFLPLKKVITSPRQPYIAANGQFILINRETYLSIGGHEKVKANVVEDMELAREVKMKKKKVITLVGDSTVYCKMYASFNDAFNGFSKNYFPGFNTNYIVFSLLLILMFFIYFVPYILVFIKVEFIFVVFLILSSRVFVALISKQNIIHEVIFHPLQIIILVALGINSIIVTQKKKATWKGRVL